MQRSRMLLGEDTLVLLVLALGAAMFVGNGLAVLRPRARPRTDNDLPRAPVTRAVVMMVIGLTASLWAIASLVNG